MCDPGVTPARLLAVSQAFFIHILTHRSQMSLRISGPTSHYCSMVLRTDHFMQSTSAPLLGLGLSQLKPPLLGLGLSQLKPPLLGLELSQLKPPLLGLGLSQLKPPLLGLSQMKCPLLGTGFAQQEGL